MGEDSARRETAGGRVFFAHPFPLPTRQKREKEANMLDKVRDVRREARPALIPGPSPADAGERRRSVIPGGVA